MNNVAAFPKSKKSKAVPVAKAPSKAFKKRMRRQAAAGVALGLVTLTLTALSLSHLAHGIQIVTGCDTWEARAMAIGIDLGFITMEMANLMAASKQVVDEISKFTKPAIVGTMLGSAAMNAFAFAAAATGYMIVPAVVLGLAIPGFIYAATRAGAALYIDCNSKA